MRWVSFPPVFSLLLLIPTAIFHSRESAVRVPPVIWGATIAAYICLCCVSAFFISRKDGAYGAGVNFLSQGVLLSVISLQSGSVLMSWVGLVLFVIGLSLAFFYATNGASMMSGNQSAPEADNGETRERIDSLLAKLDLPICVTDAKGIIVGVTPKFCDASGGTEEELVGEVINEIVPIDQETVTFGSGKWWISQAKEGARYYFSLLPTPECLPMPTEPTPLEHAGGLSIFDRETGLCIDEYRMWRGPQEISRSQRYKRSVSGILLELTFEPASGITISAEQRHMLFIAFASRVKQALRIPDCGFLLPDNRIQLILPETPLAGGKTLMSRLITLPQDVFDDDIREAVHPKVKAGIFFYNGTTKMEYGIFSAALEEDFIKSRESSGAGHAASGEAA
jgi:PAS domain-containing protein